MNPRVTKNGLQISDELNTRKLVTLKFSVYFSPYLSVVSCFRGLVLAHDVYGSRDKTIELF